MLNYHLPACCFIQANSLTALTSPLSSYLCLHLLTHAVPVFTDAPEKHEGRFSFLVSPLSLLYSKQLNNWILIKIVIKTKLSKILAYDLYKSMGNLKFITEKHTFCPPLVCFFTLNTTYHLHSWILTKNSEPSWINCRSPEIIPHSHVQTTDVFEWSQSPGLEF